MIVLSSEWIFPEKLSCFNPVGSRYEQVFDDPIALICYAQYRRKHLVSDKENEWLPYFREEVRRVKPKKILALGSLVCGFLRKNTDGLPLVYLKHPRWYQSHGALNSDSQAFAEMVQEYRKGVFGK